MNAYLTSTKTYGVQAMDKSVFYRSQAGTWAGFARRGMMRDRLLLQLHH